jgi:YD repeat-containing protein
LIAISVTSPAVNGASDVRGYIYDSPVHSSLLTGITINGSRYSTYSYFADSRVSVSSLAGGEVNDTFSYTSVSTTVVDARGQSTVYGFVSAQGARKLSSVSRQPTLTCPVASVAQTTYDANGWTDYTLDWNGNKDDYSFDATGKLLQLTLAANTTAAQTQVNTWTGNKLTSELYKDANGASIRKVDYSYFPGGSNADLVQTIVHTDLVNGGTRSLSFAYVYSGLGVLQSRSITEALPGGSAVTTYAYSAAGNLVTITNALGQQTSVSGHNGRGLPGRVVDANGVATDFVYDAKSNLVTATTIVNGQPRSTSFAHNADRLPTDIFNPDGSVDRMRYDSAMKLIDVGNVQGEYVNVAVDLPPIP